jgi:LPXTG-site transpeptidase (sortase) family protein
MIKRSQIDTRFLNYRSEPLTRTDRSALGELRTMEQRISFLARREQHEVGTGAAIGRVVIGKIGASFDVVQGTDTASLEKGPGHDPTTACPGIGQTVAIAGHRTTYLAPFRQIDSLSPGDRIVLKMPYARFTYVVQYHKIVPPDHAVGERQHRLRAAHAVRVRPAVQRSAADHRVRAPAGGAAGEGRADSGDAGRLERQIRRRRGVDFAADWNVRTLHPYALIRVQNPSSGRWDVPIDDMSPMGEDHEKVADMSKKISGGEYRVDPVAVADAILRQVRALAVARSEHVRSGDHAPAADARLRPNAHSPRAGQASR